MSGISGQLARESTLRFTGFWRQWAAIAPLQALHQQAVVMFESTVQELVRSGSSCAHWIERTLDQFLNHARVPTGLALFTTLCRYYWALNPQATASCIHAYRAMWDSDDASAAEEVKP